MSGSVLLKIALVMSIIFCVTAMSSAWAGYYGGSCDDCRRGMWILWFANYEDDFLYRGLIHDVEIWGPPHKGASYWEMVLKEKLDDVEFETGQTWKPPAPLAAAPYCTVENADACYTVYIPFTVRDDWVPGSYEIRVLFDDNKGAQNKAIGTNWNKFRID